MTASLRISEKYLPNICELEKDERIIYIAITDDFKGNMIYLFENGRCESTI
jgi:hypothetical protein